MVSSVLKRASTERRSLFDGGLGVSPRDSFSLWMGAGWGERTFLYRLVSGWTDREVN